VAREVDERRAGGHARADHFADENVVIADGEALAHGAFDGCQHAREYWHAGLAAPPLQTIEAVLPLTSEALRKIALVLG
jgi:hypothetical protein